MSKFETLYIDLPSHFDFRQTIFSHGWYQLAPFEFDAEKRRLSYVFNFNGKTAAVSVGQLNGKLKIVIAESNLERDYKNRILRDVRHVFRLDDDLSAFYQITAEHFPWISRTNSGRMLRSPTVFEDLVKTICTTNCSWALTKKITKNIVDLIGTVDKNGNRAFPTAEQMANRSADFYRTAVRAGYRASYFAELAQQVAAGKINPENWLNSDLSTSDLKREIKRVKGVGDYASENLLKLLGRYDGLALDSWLRAQFYKKHNNGSACDDEKIRNYYEKYGSWRGLVMWCDMSEKQID